MNTEQSYAGGGNNVPQTSPTAQNAGQSALQPDGRQHNPVEVDPDVYHYQSQLLDLVSDFFSLKTDPIEVVNNLLYHWLTTPASDLSRMVDKDQLRMALELVTFLSAVHRKHESVLYFTNEANQKGGRDNG